MRGPGTQAAGRILRQALGYAASDGVPSRSLLVALIVGSVLNLINQGDRLVTGQPPDVLKLALTYCVPYLVSTYGAVSFHLYAARTGARQPGPQEETQHGFSRSGQPIAKDL